MEKFQRNERVAVLMKMLSDLPGKLFTLSCFTEIFSSAKSTISEDIDIVKNLLTRFGMGSIETIPGASGGIRFIPSVSEKENVEIVSSLCSELSKKERILPGGYIYMLDIIYNPVKVSEIARILASRFYSSGVDYVITVETKGIPLALMTAKFLGVPLIIARHYNEATDGPSVNINYISGSSNKIQTMVLSLKSLKKHSRILFIDDFMKAGGTAKGIIDLTKEFDCEVCGIGVLIETEKPERKLVDNYFSILTLHKVNTDEGIINITPSGL